MDVHRVVRWGAVALAVALAFAVGWALTGRGSATGDSTGPPRPAYVNSQGRVVPALLPGLIPVADHNGNIVGYTKSSDAFAAPAGPFAPVQRTIVYNDKGQPIGTMGPHGFRRGGVG